MVTMKLGEIKSPKRRNEAQKMLELIDQLIERNEGNCYSNEMFKELEKQKEILRKEEERRRNDMKNALERKEIERILEKNKRQRNIDELESKLEKEKEKLDELQWESNDSISELRDQIEELRAESWNSEQRIEGEYQKLKRRLEELDNENDILDRKIANQKLQRSKQKKSVCHIM